MHYIPYICFALSIALCWFSKRIALCVFIGALATALSLGVLQMKALWVIPVLFGTLTIMNRPYPKTIKAIAHIGLATLCFLLFFRLIPGITNFKIFDAIQFSPHCYPFTMYLNMDNGIIAFCLSYMLVPLARTKIEWKEALRSARVYSILCILSLIGTALAIHYVKVDIKFPPESAIFLLNNLLLVCIAEESFFRGYLQKQLTTLFPQNQWAKISALLIASIIFGLRHYQSGIPMIALSAVAGLFYGAAFMRSNRIESAILVHFLLNAAHFFFFSYPALMR